jgi:hypothetical protein
MATTSAARTAKRQSERASKLRLDRRPVDDRPDLGDPAALEPVDHVLREDHPPAVHRQTEKQTLGPAVELETACHIGRFADQEFDVELKVRNLLEIAPEHGAIAGKPERPAVVARLVQDELTQTGPILPVEAGDIGPVAVGKGVFGHGCL